MTTEPRARPEAELDPQTAYRLRTVRVGIVLTLLVVAGLALWPLSPDVTLPAADVYYGLLVVGVLGALGVTALPWPRLFARGWGVPTMYVWSVADIGIITGLVAVTGGGDSPVFLVYVFTTVFFAASYPLWGQVALAAFTALAYTGVVLVGGGFAWSELGFRLFMLALVAYMAGFLSRELLAVTDVADRRGRLLGRVAAASRELHQLDHAVVLREAVEAACTLGWDAAALEVVDQADPNRTVVQHSRGLPASYRGQQRLDEGAMGLVSSAKEPVVIADYAQVAGANEEVVAAGIRSGVGVPVLVRGRLAGALFAGTTAERSITPFEVEALELLATTVSLALENAAAFADQQRANERLAELDAAKTDFILTASHELRTPMTIAHGMTLTLRQRWENLDETTRQLLLDRMEAGTEQLRRLVDTLVEYARASVAAGTGTDAVTPVSSTVTAAVNEIASRHPDRELVVEADSADVRADATAVSRVLEHLVSNAVAHTPASSLVRVTVRRDDTAGVVRFTVADDGPGMTADQLEEAEGRFVRGGPIDERSSGGLGLGLPLVRRLLAVYGADLDIASTPESGTAATFTLPLATADLTLGEGSAELV